MAYSNKGYTLDQTILIVAVIAILSTIIVSQLGGRLINRVHGVKIASSLKEIQQANQFFKIYHQAWPHEVTSDSDPFENAAVLANNESLEEHNRMGRQPQNLLPGYKLIDNTLLHDHGTGGEVEQSVQHYNGADYLVITLHNIPLEEAKEADRIMDGKVNPDKGLLLFDEKNATTATVHYLATPIR